MLGTEFRQGNQKLNTGKLYSRDVFTLKQFFVVPLYARSVDGTVGPELCSVNICFCKYNRGSTAEKRRGEYNEQTVLFGSRGGK